LAHSGVLCIAGIRNMAKIVHADNRLFSNLCIISPNEKINVQQKQQGIKE
jgi:hypothetical protein